MVTVITQIVADADDGTHQATAHAHFVSGALCQLGFFSAGANLRLAAWTRYTNVQVPQGAGIIAAYLLLEAERPDSNVIVNGRIDAEATDNSGTPTHIEFDGGALQSDGHGRQTGNRTAAQILWSNVVPVTAGKKYRTPDFSSVIQEIVDRLGWAIGNALTLYWGDEDNESTNSPNTRRLFQDFGAGADKAPQLVVEYTDLVTSKRRQHRASIEDAAGVIQGQLIG